MTDKTELNALLRSHQDKDHQIKQLMKERSELRRRITELEKVLKGLNAAYELAQVRESYMQRAIWHLEDFRASAVEILTGITESKKVKDARKVAQAFVEKAWTRQLNMDRELGELRRKGKAK